MAAATNPVPPGFPVRKVWVSLPKLDEGLVRTVRTAKVTRKSIKAAFCNSVYAALLALDFMAEVVVRGPEVYQEPRFQGWESEEAMDVARVAITGAEAATIEQLAMLANQLGTKGELKVRGKYRGR